MDTCQRVQQAGKSLRGCSILQRRRGSEHRHYDVVGAQSTATTAFGQNAPELLVVALTCRLLVGSHRVAAEHAAAPSSAFETPALQALPIIELDSSID